MEPWAAVSKHPEAGTVMALIIPLPPAKQTFGLRKTFRAHLAGKRASPGARANAPKNEYVRPSSSSCMGRYFIQQRVCLNSESSEYAFPTVTGEINLPSVPSQLPVPHGIEQCCLQFQCVARTHSPFPFEKSKFCNCTRMREGKLECEGKPKAGACLSSGNDWSVSAAPAEVCSRVGSGSLKMNVPKLARG